LTAACIASTIAPPTRRAPSAPGRRRSASPTTWGRAAHRSTPLHQATTRSARRKRPEPRASAAREALSRPTTLAGRRTQVRSLDALSGGCAALGGYSSGPVLSRDKSRQSARQLSLRARAGVCCEPVGSRGAAGIVVTQDDVSAPDSSRRSSVRLYSCSSSGAALTSGPPGVVQTRESSGASCVPFVLHGVVRELRT
jgi:hypothetical protein